MSQFVTDRAFLFKKRKRKTQPLLFLYKMTLCYITHKERLSLSPFVSSSFSTWISNWNSEKEKKKFVLFFGCFQTTGPTCCVRDESPTSHRSSSQPVFFCLLPPWRSCLFLLFWNRAHLTPHSYSLLVDINNRPTLYFSFLLLLFSFPSLVWGSHVVSLLFFPPSRPTSDAELTTMNRYIFLSVFIYIYNTLLLVRQTGTIGPYYIQQPPPPSPVCRTTSP